MLLVCDNGDGLTGRGSGTDDPEEVGVPGAVGERAGGVLLDEVDDEERLRLWSRAGGVPAAALDELLPALP